MKINLGSSGQFYSSGRKIDDVFCDLIDYLVEKTNLNSIHYSDVDFCKIDLAIHITREGKVGGTYITISDSSFVEYEDPVVTDEWRRLRLEEIQEQLQSHNRCLSLLEQEKERISSELTEN